MSNNENSSDVQRTPQILKQNEILQRIMRKKMSINKKRKIVYNTENSSDGILIKDEMSKTNNFIGSYLGELPKGNVPSSSNENQSMKLSETVAEKKEKFSIKFNKASTANPISQVKIDDASGSDWFQDAIKRAKDKAKEVLPNKIEVSLSADSLPSALPSNPVDIQKRRSRWGNIPQAIPVNPVISIVNPVVKQQVTNFNMPMNIMGMVGQGQHMEAIQGIMISKLTRDNPAIINYASKVFGTLDITDAQWKQCEEQMKMNIVFQVLEAKKVEAEKLIQQGKVKYEYDSDEDTDGGTWEHKRRKLEMEDTATRAVEMTRESDGKHHIGDFLPPEELSGFLEKYSAIKDGRDPDLSDYRENRITEDNVGYKMLKSMGWTEGAGLGSDGKGITAPVNQKPQTERQGVGAGIVNDLQANDDEFDAYRKRMMLAYRYRPNPLNNPRRTYY